MASDMPTTKSYARNPDVFELPNLIEARSSLLTPRYLAAFVAGAVYAFSASRMMYLALGHYNFVTIQWFPFYTLFLLKTLRQGGFKNILMASLFAAFCLYAELTFSVRAGMGTTWSGMQCSNNYCHGSTLTGGTATSPIWTKVDGTQAECTACHGAPPPPPHPPSPSAVSATTR